MEQEIEKLLREFLEKQASRQGMKELFFSLPCILCAVISSDGTIEIINDAMEKNLGLSAGMNFFTYVLQHSLPSLKELLKTGGNTRICMQTPQGKELFLRGCFLSAPNQIVVVLQDESELRQKIKEFLSISNHIIRNFLEVIVGNTGFLMLQANTIQQQECVDTLHHNCELLLSIFSNVFDYLNLEVGWFSPVRERFDLLSLVEQSIHPLLASAEAKKLKIHIEPKSTIKEVVGDSFCLQQLLSHIVENAIRSSIRGSIQLTVRSKQETEDAVVLEFIVQAAELDPRYADKVQLQKECIDDHFHMIKVLAEVGIEMMIIKKTVSILGGSFTYEHPRYYVQLELGKAKGEPHPIGPSKKTVEKPGKAARILVVDDNISIQKLLLLQLKQIGYRADAASNGQEALQKVEQSSYEVILMDCEMPVMNGYEATKIIRKQEGEKRHTIILALTGNSMPEEKRRCLQAGMDDVLVKPVTVEVLALSLANWARWS